MADFELPGYELYERLGRGGMATVYRALHLNLDREVAIKVMDPAMNADESFSERFIREARISARLTHPHILQIYDVNTFNGLNYIAMELLGGGELADFIHNAMPQQQIYTIIKQMGEALDYASGRGYVHRDIKPSNIMLRAPGDYVLADFGIARAANSGTQMTQTGLMVGTPSYMSPEQAKGEEVDGRSDLYALGVLIYEMLTKQLPYESESAVTTAVKHLTEAIPTLPEKLSPYQDFIDHALAKSPDDRYQSGAELYQAFMAASAGFGDDEVLMPAAPPRPPRNSSTSVANAERTSLSGVDSTRLSGSSASVGPGSSRPYRLEGSQQRERLVSGTYDSGRRRQKKSGAGLLLWVFIGLLAAGGGGYYWWQGQGSSNTDSKKNVTAELARAYSAMNQDNLPVAAASFYNILNVDSKNTAAQDGMQEVGRLYTAAVEKALEQRDPVKAGALLTDYGLYFSSASNLEGLSSRVDLLREELQLASVKAKRADKLLGQAADAIAAEDFDSADDLISQAAAINPDHPQIASQREVLAAARARSEAYEARWAGFSPEQREAFIAAITAADGALDAGDLAVAREQLDAAGAIAPEAQELLRRKERLAAAENEVRAGALAEATTRLDATDAAVAKLSSDSGNVADLVEAYREVGEQFPGESRVADGLAAIETWYLERARAAAAEGDFKSAGSIAAEGTTLLPEASQLAKLESALPAQEKAWADQEAAAEKEREQLAAALRKAETTVRNGQNAVRSGDLDAASEAYETARTDYPDLPAVADLGKDLLEAYAGVAREQIGLNDLESARASVDRGEQDFPNDPVWQKLRVEIEEASSSSRRRLGVY
ncbi:protein kinase domain-containing protein [Haliea sp. E17]|uniref:serine/threonine protein kinase n=1 Tax=Haliea sp. E17 TaxID=3401576 RepID=UPI003AAE4252